MFCSRSSPPLVSGCHLCSVVLPNEGISNSIILESRFFGKVRIILWLNYGILSFDWERVPNLDMANEPAYKGMYTCQGASANMRIEDLEGDRQKRLDKDTFFFTQEVEASL
ncbi:hypothetical protein EUGRSUZ_C00170 [Eucalyptus grandis]|uniref:Uncharacterized protein n=2 Tax=Eucalyptus grandis TaxID=71139 RepID=A0ACC3L9S9_EUCGR|nr:hypothetical protein EUGRSUZ_C00170 [Eucalyptus grandis]